VTCSIMMFLPVVLNIISGPLGFVTLRRQLFGSPLPPFVHLCE
jgi:hypothetical protein